MIRTDCTHCGTHLEVPSHYAGKEIRCTSCAQPFSAQPAAAQAAPVAPPVPAAPQPEPPLSNAFAKRCLVGTGVAVIAGMVAFPAWIYMQESRDKAARQASNQARLSKLDKEIQALAKEAAEASESKAYRLERERRAAPVLKASENYLDLDAKITQDQYARGAITEAERDRKMDRIDAKREKAQQEYDDAVWGKGKRP